MFVKEGQYNTPLYILYVREGRISVTDTRGDSEVVWHFDKDRGTFSKFEVSSAPVRTFPRVDKAVMACEHVTPEYAGVLYYQESLGTIFAVCPSCVRLNGMVMAGKMSIFSPDVFESLLGQGKIVVFKLEK